MAQADFTRIASNIGALNALYALRRTNGALGLHQTRLATGRRINSAEEDPAGLSIATKMNARSEGLKVALDNIGDAKNMLSVAEAGLSKINDILVQMRTKAEAAASDTLGSAERAAIQSQLNSWALEINAIVDTTKWNGKKLLDGMGDFGGTVTFQVGADTDSANQVQLTSSDFAAVSTQTIGIGETAATISGATSTGGGGDEFSMATSAAFTGLTELANGTYTLYVTVGAATSSATIQLRDASGGVVGIDADGTSTTLILAESVVISGLDGSGTTTYDLGRGATLTINEANLDVSTNYTYTFTYSRSGTYNGDVTTASNALSAMTALDTAISTVSTRLSTVGALGGRLSFREETLSVAQVNTEAAYNRIMNADMAFEQVEVTKLSILSQTSMAMLSQANMAPQGVLSLFR